MVPLVTEFQTKDEESQELAQGDIDKVDFGNEKASLHYNENNIERVAGKIAHHNEMRCLRSER